MTELEIVELLRKDLKEEIQTAMDTAALCILEKLSEFAETKMDLAEYDGDNGGRIAYRDTLLEIEQLEEIINSRPKK